MPSCGCASYQATVVGGLRAERRQAVNLRAALGIARTLWEMEKAQ